MKSNVMSSTKGSRTSRRPSLRAATMRTLSFELGAGFKPAALKTTTATKGDILEKMNFLRKELFGNKKLLQELFDLQAKVLGPAPVKLPYGDLRYPGISPKPISDPWAWVHKEYPGSIDSYSYYKGAY